MIIGSNVFSHKDVQRRWICEVVNLAKFPLAVCKICLQTIRIQSHMHEQAETECLQQLITGKTTIQPTLHCL